MAHCWTKIWLLGLQHPKDASTRVPTQVTYRTFKKRLGPQGYRGGGKYSHSALPVNSFLPPEACRTELRARIISIGATLSTICHESLTVILKT